MKRKYGLEQHYVCGIFNGSRFRGSAYDVESGIEVSTDLCRSKSEARARAEARKLLKNALKLYLSSGIVTIGTRTFLFDTPMNITHLYDDSEDELHLLYAERNQIIEKKIQTINEIMITAYSKYMQSIFEEFEKFTIQTIAEMKSNPNLYPYRKNQYARPILYTLGHFSNGCAYTECFNNKETFSKLKNVGIPYDFHDRLQRIVLFQGNWSINNIIETNKEFASDLKKTHVS
jgi:hypothetical protein